MMFSVPRPENDDRRYRELAVSGHDGIRLVSVEHDPLDRVTTYVFAFDDGPPGAELDCLDEENDVPFGSLDCTSLVTHDRAFGVGIRGPAFGVRPISKLLGRSGADPTEGSPTERTQSESRACRAVYLARERVQEAASSWVSPGAALCDRSGPFF